MKILRDEKGQMLILTVLSMTVLLGVLAFATDIGVLFRARRNLQIVADAAATAGALDLKSGGTTTVVKADATTVADQNLTAFNYSTSTATVTINTPPLYGYHESGIYVEAIVTTPNPTFFMNLFGFHSMNVTARAVAGVVNNNNNCMYVLYNGTTSPALTIQGAATIQTSTGGKTCGIQDNGNISVIGSGNTINAAYVDVAGTQPTNGNGSGTMTNTTTNFGTGQVQDPFGNIITDGEPSAYPTPTCSTTIAGNSYSGTYGTASSSASSTTVVCFTGTNVNIGGATLNNGVFLFENGVYIPNGTTTTINNGTLDVYGGYYQQGSSTGGGSNTSILNIIAPQNSSWNNGIALMVPATNVSYPNSSTYPGNTIYTDNYSCSGGGASGANAYQNVLQVQWGSSGQTFQGWIYAPTATVSLQDQGGGVTYTGLVSGSVCLNGTMNFPSYDNQFPQYSPLRTVALVE